MRRILSILCIIVSLADLCHAQARKPTIMVVPSDVWCNKNGYMMEFDNQGSKVKIPDYKRAFQENSDLVLVISKINGMMAQRGFPLKNMESCIKTLEAESAEDAMTTSKNSASVAESPVDKLKKVAKSDIIMQLTWTVNETGPKKSVSFVLQGIDAYTDKQIAEAGGTGAPSFSADLPVLLEEAVLAHLDKFTNSLQAHFDDMFANGREGLIRIKKFDSWNGNFEKEYDGKELNAVIEDWMRANAVNSRYSLSDVTENMMVFEQVRIPLFDASNNAIDTRTFLKGLQKTLSTSPYNIPSKLTMKGLGQATLVLGDK